MLLTANRSIAKGIPGARYLSLLVALAITLGFVRPAAADEAETDHGQFITVQNPIDSQVVEWVKETTRRALDRPDRRVKKIIFDFNPDNRPAGSSQYSACSELAEFILGLHQVITVAFVHSEVSRHTVLPVLACREIVMSSTARIGDVSRDLDKPLLERRRQEYADLAKSRPWPPAIIQKMIHKDLEVYEENRGGRVEYLAFDRQGANAAKVPQGKLVARQGEAMFSAAEAQKFGLCLRILETRREVAEAYNLPASSLREDPLQGRTPNVWHIEISGPVTPALKETLQRRVRRAVAQGANTLILELTCAGGDTQAARDLADFFRTLKDDTGQLPVKTVAYVPERAPDTATFLAFGCTEIVMKKDAVLGDFEDVVKANPDRFEMKRDSLVGLAQEQGYSPLLAQGMFDRALTIYRVRSKQLEFRLVSGDDLRKDQMGERKWVQQEQVKAEGELLTLKADRAEKLGVASRVVQNLQEVYRIYAKDPSQVREASPDWLDGLAAFLRLPTVSVLLVMVGIICLILELKLAGVGLPGVVAALCFVLFFWAHSQLAGQITMLAVLLFLLGLVLVGIEIFLLPGFGVIGISGIVLVLVGLGLATLEKKPETSQEWVSFGNTLLLFGGGLIGAVIGAMFLGRYLPNIPFANRLVLTPPTDRTEVEEEAPAGLSSESAAALLGAIGVAATTLRPAGMARFGDSYVDVVTEGDYIPAGARVQVIEIEGNRIVVKEV